MSAKNFGAEELPTRLLAKGPWIDVRAPVEFSQGHLPGAVNLPLLNDKERAMVGTTYRKEGQAAAIQLGHQLVSGTVKSERVETWLQFLRAHPDAILHCFRGGLRSQITQQWLAEAGYERPLLIGGYKAARAFLLARMARISSEKKFILISGVTGSGKTELLQSLKGAVDLESLAEHRGSAFGGRTDLQPAQATFENRVALALMRTPGLDPIFLEDESRLIGRCVIPAEVFAKMRDSEVIVIEEPRDARVERIRQEYVVNGPPVDFKKPLMSIQKKLGGLRAAEILKDIKDAEQVFSATGDTLPSKIWIEKLLRYYYDPIYLSNLQRRQVRVIFRGSRDKAREFCRHKFTTR